MIVFWALFATGSTLFVTSVAQDSVPLAAAAIVAFIASSQVLRFAGRDQREPDLGVEARAFATVASASELADGSPSAPSEVAEPELFVAPVVDAAEEIVAAAAAAAPEPQLVAVLGRIDGLGAARASRLAAHFLTLDTLKAADIGALTTVDGIGPKLAATVHAAVAPDPRDVLKQIPGVGPATRESLASTFPTVVQLRTATVDELTTVRGIGPAMATRILAGLVA